MCKNKTMERQFPKLRAFLLICIFVGMMGKGITLAHQSYLDLSNAVVVSNILPTNPKNRSVEMLVEEVEKIRIIRFKTTNTWPDTSTPIIALGLITETDKWAGPYLGKFLIRPGNLQPEGYQIRIFTEGRLAPAVMIAGNDYRGLLFGVGHLMRKMRMREKDIRLPADFEIITNPRYAIRGHQIGYRPKTNSYDAWTVEIWEQYIRDLVVFGTNAAEMIPPRSDDKADSPHFPLPQIEMIVKVSEILDSYDMDVWMWYPALDKDYSDPATVEFALKEWGEIFSSLPSLDAIMVPGGDPGHTHPKHMMPFLEKQTQNLKKYHPDAQMWMSPQGFETKWMDYFYEYLRTKQPKWLTGIVYGPQIQVDLSEMRALIPKQYPIRRYPDITHSVRSQYAVPYMDLAYALTEGREPINPRPIDHVKIFRAYEKAAIGFITYSEGCQ
jgi:hypothetical protein